MTYTRHPYIEKIISHLKVGQETELKGIVTPKEVIKLCGLMREMLNGREISENEREVLQRYTELHRCFTVAEANRIAAIYGSIKFKRVRPKSGPVKIEDEIPF
jgi:predicted RNA binding protein with dsRBD fold (UPF0201 family)